MKASIFHDTPSWTGGAERVCIAVTEVLSEMGIETELLTYTEPDFQSIQNLFGKKPIIDTINVLTRREKKRLFGIYEQLHFIKVSSDLCINTQANRNMKIIPENGQLIMYLNAAPEWPPIVNILNTPSKYKSIGWNFYFSHYKAKAKELLDEISKHKFVVCSSYIKEETKQIFKALSYNINPNVIYPPVDIDSFTFKEDKDNLVVTAGRITPEKNFEFALEVIQYVNSKLIIIGPSYDNDYILQIKNMIERYGLQEKVDLLVDVPFSTYREVLAKSKVYLHCFKKESFGISVVEAMSSGCLPMIPPTGGPSEFVPKRYHYSSLEDCVEKLNTLLKAEKSEQEYVAHLSKKFHEKHFKESMRKMIEELICDGVK